MSKYNYIASHHEYFYIYGTHPDGYREHEVVYTKEAAFKLACKWRYLGYTNISICLDSSVRTITNLTEEFNSL